MLANALGLPSCAPWVMQVQEMYATSDEEEEEEESEEEGSSSAGAWLGSGAAVGSSLQGTHTRLWQPGPQRPAAVLVCVPATLLPALLHGCKACMAAWLTQALTEPQRSLPYTSTHPTTFGLFR